MVQISEAIPEKSQAYQLGYKTICEIGKERIRRSGSRIIVVADGKICEEGSHEALLAKDGLYARLYHTQNIGQNMC